MKRAAPVPTVLYSVPPPSDASNPYTTMLAEGVAKSVTVQFFSWQRALLGRHDVLHVHWPEALVRSSSAGRRLLRLLAGHAYLTIAHARGIRIVRTVHNREPHEAGSLLERSFITRLDRATNRRVYLSSTPDAVDATSLVIAHGHYRDWPGYRSERVSKRRQLLMFGALRRYKGIEDAIAAFAELERNDRASFVISGGVLDEAYAHALRDAATADSRISVSLTRVPSRELAALVASSAVVALPYRDFYNSGAALLALSLGTHIVAPSTPSSRLLRDEFGPAWVSLYEGPLTADVLRRSLDAGERVPDAGPDMRARDWEPIIDAHVQLYRELVEVR